MSNGKLLHGQLMHGHKQVIVPYTQQECDEATALTYIGQDRTEVNPTDRGSSLVKQFGIPDLSGAFYSYIAPGSIELPNVLTSLSVVYNKGGGDTTFIENANCAASGTAWSVGASVSGTTQASSYCVPKLLHTIDSAPATNVPTINCFFYTTSLDTATILSILSTKLGATVLEWPLFKPQPLSFVLFGERTSASGRQDYQASASFNSGSSSSTLVKSEGFGFGNDKNPNAEDVQIPPTLHGAFTLLSNDSNSHTGSTSVTITGGILSGGGSNSATADASGSVTPNTVAATSPPALPTSGLYLYRVIPDEILIYGNYPVRAIVFDFASIA